jgi:hypothetical protein
VCVCVWGGEDGYYGVGQEKYLAPGGLEDCYWCDVRHTTELHYCTQAENIKQLRVVCSECICAVFCGCCVIY